MATGGAEAPVPSFRMVDPAVSRLGWRAGAGLCALALLAAALVVTSAPQRASATSYQDWPTFLGNSRRTAATTDPNLSVAATPLLKLHWAFKTGAPIAASTSIVGTTAYVGSWDGYEYAIDTTTGAQVWKRFIGITQQAQCSPSTLGVT